MISWHWFPLIVMTMVLLDLCGLESMPARINAYEAWWTEAVTGLEDGNRVKALPGGWMECPSRRTTMLPLRVACRNAES